MISLRNSTGIPGRRQGASVDCAGEQSGEHFRRAARLNHRVIPSSLHVAPLEDLHGEVVGGCADARHAYLSAAQVFQPFNLGFGENTLGQMVFDARDEHEVVVATTTVRTSPTPPSIMI